MGGKPSVRLRQFMGPTTVLLAGVGLGALCLVGFGATQLPHLGKQADGSFLVSSGQRIGAGTIHFKGRPSDIALHPGGQIVAVLSHEEVFLANAKQIQR